MSHLILDKRVKISNLSDVLNAFCKKKLDDGVPLEDICNLAVKQFCPPYSDTWIRKHIDDKFKNVSQKNNASKKRLSGVSKIKDKLSKIKKEESNLLHQLQLARELEK